MRYLAAYTRVSTDRQAKEGFSIEGQVKSILAWAEDRDIEIVKWYKDEDISGARENRPQYDKMVHEVCNEIVKVDGIIFFSTSRMGRNLAVTTATRNKLKKLRKVIVSAHENLIIKDAASALVFNLMGAVNESFCEGGGELVVQ
ncbi:recombinase family protein [Pseudoalteromonas lipolytica]|uniref:Recombinase family protein n=1 Tax=Pseudoalteromonas lipolytica TaxID=570156 RepID=A0ABU8SVK9_9GAMM